VQVKIVGLVPMRIGVESTPEILRIELVETHSYLISGAT